MPEKGLAKNHRRGKVLFIYDNLTEFIRRDIEILKKDFEVIPHEYKGKKDLLRLIGEVKKSDINISRFVLGYATIAVLFSKILRK